MFKCGWFDRRYLTFDIMSDMNFCPPNPGSTVIIKIISASATKSSTVMTGVLGLRPIPTFIPASLIFGIIPMDYLLPQYGMCIGLHQLHPSVQPIFQAGQPSYAYQTLLLESLTEDI